MFTSALHCLEAPRDYTIFSGSCVWGGRWLLLRGKFRISLCGGLFCVEQFLFQILYSYGLYFRVKDWNRSGQPFCQWRMEYCQPNFSTSLPHISTTNNSPNPCQISSKRTRCFSSQNAETKACVIWGSHELVSIRCCWRIRKQIWNSSIPKKFYQSNLFCRFKWAFWEKSSRMMV